MNGDGGDFRPPLSPRIGGLHLNDVITLRKLCDASIVLSHFQILPLPFATTSESKADMFRIEMIKRSEEKVHHTFVCCQIQLTGVQTKAVGSMNGLIG